MNISIIVPAFNEEKTIAAVIEKLVNIKIPNTKKEIIIINDGSTDKTALEINRIKKEIKDLIVITHSVNKGKGAAVKSGMEKANGDYILIQDADLEYNPKDIEKLVSPLILSSNNQEAVYGTRLNRLPNFRRDERTLQFFIQYIGNKFLSLLTSILYGQWITDMETGYKLFPKSSLVRIKLKSRSFDFEPEITAKLLKNGHRIIEVPISTNPRGYDEGKKLDPVKDGLIALWTLIKYRFIS